MPEVTMPVLGLTMESGTIQKWLKQPGEHVEKEEPLFVVETDKAAIEVGAPASGTLTRIIVPEGGTAPTGQPIAEIDGDSEATLEAPATRPAAAAPPAEARPAGPGPQAPAREARAAGDEARIFVTPRARLIARELGVDLALVRGSGPGGRIQERDVREFAERRAAPVAPAASAPSPAPVAPAREAAPAAREAAIEPLSRLRRIVADRMAASARSVARVTLFAEVDATELVRFREQIKDDFATRRNARVTFDALIVKASAVALAEHPDVRAQWADGGLRRVDDVHVGFAVAAPEGLFVPVVRHADRLRLEEVCRDVDRLAEKARTGRLLPADYGNGTFTITNLGQYGVDAFTPIINPPETAILGVGRIVRRPAVVGDRVEPRDVLWLTLAFDHRVVDGAPAAEFLRRIREVLEKPYLLLA